MCAPLVVRQCLVSAPTSYGNRFGISYVDFDILEWIPKLSAEWFREAARKNAAVSALPDAWDRYLTPLERADAVVIDSVAVLASGDQGVAGQPLPITRASADYAPKT